MTLAAVDAKRFKWYEDNLPARDMTQPREVTIIAVVEGTADKNRADQEKVLAKQGLRFADERDQALAAALHACLNDGRDLFKRYWVRGSVPGFVLSTDRSRGVCVVRCIDVFDFNLFAASGSPSPE